MDMVHFFFDNYEQKEAMEIELGIKFLNTNTIHNSIKIDKYFAEFLKKWIKLYHPNFAYKGKK